MKTKLLVTILVTIYGTDAFSDVPMDSETQTVTVGENFFARLDADERDALRAANCPQGSTGWWIELDMPASQAVYETGGVDSSSGAFTGCGTCAQCRTKLEQEIIAVQAGRKSGCEARGGVEHSVGRGSRVEKIDLKTWTIRQEGVTSKCKKWIPC